MNKRSFVLLLATLVLLPKTVNATPFTNLFVVGDSLSDVGNLFIATDSFPLDAFFPEPLPQDPPYFMGRFSNGPVWVEYVSESLGLGASIPAFANGTNYAVGGARTRYHRFDPVFDMGFDPLNDPTMFPQFTLLGQSQALLSAEMGNLASDALYTVWGGSNDVADAVRIFAMGDPTAAGLLITQAANDILAVVNDFVTAGAENLLVPNVPNIGLVPEVVALEPMFPGAQMLAALLSQSLNDIVDAGLAGLAADITRLDTFAFLTALVNDPTLFGLPADLNVTDPCFTGFVGEPGVVCTNPEQYAFWDRIHPSAVTHQVLGGIAAAAVPEPAPIALVALGLFGIGYFRRKNANG